MLGYYLRLALKSCVRDARVTLLIVFAISVGIGVCIMTLTIYHAMSANPIWWKDDRLYAVTMDSWAAERPENPDQPQLPPPQLTYMDAMYLFNSTIPARKVLMYPVPGVIIRDRSSLPVKVTSRITSADFFAMFDVPFRYGGAWNARADLGPEPDIVISHDLNEALFGGANSVGRILRWNDHDFRIIGVLAQWQPQPRFYDLNEGNFNEPEAVYVPWGWGKALELRSSGTTRCWRPENIDTFPRLLGSDCAWLQMWVELPNAAARDRMQALMDTYWWQQRQAGRFPRPRNNRLTRVGQWLVDHQVVQNDNRLLLGLAFAFLGVCLVNTVGLLLAKFIAGAPLAGVRRALGASRMQIFNQHLVEASVLAFVGAALGLAFGALLLQGVQALYGGDPEEGRGGYQALAHFDRVGIVWAVLLALLAVLAAGVYPAWRVGRVPPAVYLKSQ